MTTFHEQSLWHKSVSGGPAVKGVTCKRCGEYVGLVQSKSGKWYTCQLVQSLGENSQALRAYPFLPHSKTCGRAARAEDDRRAAREAELRKAIADMSTLLDAEGLPENTRTMAAESIDVWNECLVTEGFER